MSYPVSQSDDDNVTCWDCGHYWDADCGCLCCCDGKDDESCASA